MITRTQLRECLKNYNWADYIRLLNDYGAWLKSKELAEFITTTYLPTAAGEILNFNFRFNAEDSYNDLLVNNDLQVMAEKTAEGCYDYMFDVTTDPRTRKPGIAHFAPQVYRGNVGYHRPAIFGMKRICIRSDRGCWYFRTGEKGYKFGQIGLNQHDSNGLWNTSLGCIIYAVWDDWKNTVKGLLEKCVNKNNIPCAVIAQEFTEEYFKNRV